MKIIISIIFIIILTLVLFSYTENDDLEIINKDGYVDGTKEDSVNQVPEICKKYMKRPNNKWIPEWDSAMIDEMINSDINDLSPKDYPNSAELHAEAIEKYLGGNLQTKDCAVIGSISPWIECILLKHGAKSVSTVDYNPPKCNDNRINILDIQETNLTFDIICSYSSIEHDGLGRYGDPIDPNGDIKACEKIYKMLNKGGIFLCGVPIGKGCIEGNFHRIYNQKRLDKIFNNFELVGTAPNEIRFEGNDWQNQPIFILIKR